MKAPPAVVAALACLAFLGVVRADDPAEPETPPPRDTGRETSAAREAAAWKAITTRKFAADLRQVPLHAALEMLTSQAGVGLSLDGRVTHEALSVPLTLKLKKGSVYAVLYWIFHERNLAWGVDGREIVVAAPQDIDPGVTNRRMEFVASWEEKWRESIQEKLNRITLSLDLADVPLVRIVERVAERAGLDVVWKTETEGQKAWRASLKISDASVPQILDKLTAPAGLAWALEAEAIVISRQ